MCQKINHISFADKDADDLDWADIDVDNGNEFAVSVGGYCENGYGFYDMVGSVWE